MEAKMAKKPAAPKVVTVRNYFGLDAVGEHVPDGIQPEEGLSNRLVGIEVEVENHELRQYPKAVWTATDDGSLRNNGIEWLTRPIQARYAPGALHNLMNEALMDECCFSPRTSVHVHVNCQDVPIEKISNIVLLYSVFEPLFYRFAGRGRNKNIFCVPVLETAQLSGIADKRLNNVTDGWSKYSGLNLVPLREKGTIEFRHMHGTRDVAKLTKWVDMLTRLVDFVHKSDVGELRKLLHGFDESVNVGLLLLDIFGTSNMGALGYTGYEEIRESVANMKQAFISTGTTTKLIVERDVATAPFFTTKIVKGI